MSDNENGATDDISMNIDDNENNDSDNNDSDNVDDDDFEEVSVEKVFEELCNDKKLIPFDTLASWYFISNYFNNNTNYINKGMWFKSCLKGSRHH